MAECDHGYRPPRNGRDPYMVAVHDFFEELGTTDKCGFECIEVFARHEECVDMMMMIKLLAATGTNLIRMSHVDLARHHAEVILAMENYLNYLTTDGQTTKEANESIGEDGRTEYKYFTDSDKDLFEQLTVLRENYPEVIRFFSQRIPCDCLRDKMREVANQPRIGRCVNPSCFKTALDSTLMDCGRCKLVKYCSKECQRAHWTKHKKLCSKATSTYNCQNQHCSTSQTTDLFDCARCRKVKYCCKACQTADWPVHKRSCGRNDSGKVSSVDNQI